MCNLILSTTTCCALLLSSCWHFPMKPWKWSPSMIQKLIAGNLSSNKTVEVEPINDEGACCRRSFSHHEKVQIVCRWGEFMAEHSTSARKAISEVTSASHAQYWRNSSISFEMRRNNKLAPSIVDLYLNSPPLNPNSLRSSLSFVSRGLPSWSTRSCWKLPN